MTLLEIRKLPTTVCHDVPDGFRVHESCLRSYQILEKVKSLMAQQTPHDVISEVIADLEASPSVDLVGQDGFDNIIRK